MNRIAPLHPPLLASRRPRPVASTHQHQARPATAAAQGSRNQAAREKNGNTQIVIGIAFTAALQNFSSSSSSFEKEEEEEEEKFLSKEEEKEEQFLSKECAPGCESRLHGAPKRCRLPVPAVGPTSSFDVFTL